MNTFHKTIDSLHHFTRNLDVHRDKISCKHCKTGKHLRGHGFVYKRCYYSKPWPSGKRLICSKRYSNNGCGRTIQLYIQKAIPRKHHHARHLVIFILQLLRGLTVDRAYFSVRRIGETRNGYRWIKRLKSRMPFWRPLIQNRDAAYTITHFSQTVTDFLGTLAPFVAQDHIHFINRLQIKIQKAFFP